MGGLSPETWPILAAFLVLQTVITVPLIRYIQKTHDRLVIDMEKGCEARVADLKAQLDALITVHRAATEYAQRRGDTLHTEKEALAKQLSENASQMFRAVDALSELRAAIQDLTKERRAT